MESWARRRQGKDLALNSFTPLPGYRGVGRGCTVCAQSMVIQLKMCKDKGQILRFELGYRLHCVLISQSSTTVLIKVMNNSMQPLKTTQKVMIIVGPVLVLDCLIFCTLHKKGVDLSHFDTFSKEKSMKVNVWWPRDVGEFEETLIFVITQSSGFGSQDVQLRSPEQSWSMMLGYCGYLMNSGFQSIIHPY